MHIEIWAMIFEILLGFHLSSFTMLSKAEISSVYRENEKSTRVKHPNIIFLFFIS